MPCHHDRKQLNIWKKNFEKICSLTIQCKNFTAILMKEEEIYVKWVILSYAMYEKPQIYQILKCGWFQVGNWSPFSFPKNYINT